MLRGVGAEQLGPTPVPGRRDGISGPPQALLGVTAGRAARAREAGAYVDEHGARPHPAQVQPALVREDFTALTADSGQGGGGRRGVVVLDDRPVPRVVADVGGGDEQQRDAVVVHRPRAGALLGRAPGELGVQSCGAVGVQSDQQQAGRGVGDTSWVMPPANWRATPARRSSSRTRPAPPSAVRRTRSPTGWKASALRPCAALRRSPAATCRPARRSARTSASRPAGTTGGAAAGGPDQKVSSLREKRCSCGGPHSIAPSRPLPTGVPSAQRRAGLSYQKGEVASGIVRTHLVKVSSPAAPDPTAPTGAGAGGEGGRCGSGCVVGCCGAGAGGEGGRCGSGCGVGCCGAGAGGEGGRCGRAAGSGAAVRRGR